MRPAPHGLSLTLSLSHSLPLTLTHSLTLSPPREAHNLYKELGHASRADHPMQDERSDFTQSRTLRGDISLGVVHARPFEPQSKVNF